MGYLANGEYTGGGDSGDCYCRVIGGDLYMSAYFGRKYKQTIKSSSPNLKLQIWLHNVHKYDKLVLQSVGEQGTPTSYVENTSGKKTNSALLKEFHINVQKYDKLLP